MRHHSEEENARMLRTAREYLGHGVCAADLAGAEAVSNVRIHGTVQKRRKHLACHLPYMPVNAEVYRISLILWKPEPEESDMESQ